MGRTSFTLIGNRPSISATVSRRLLTSRASTPVPLLTLPHQDLFLFYLATISIKLRSLSTTELLQSIFFKARQRAWSLARTGGNRHTRRNKPKALF